MLDSAFGSAELQGATADVAHLGVFTRGEAAVVQNTASQFHLQWQVLGMMAGLSQLLLQLGVSDTAEVPDKCSWL